MRLCFSDFNYANAGQTLYQFYLEGYDKTWRTPSSQNYMEYGNLPPGTYIFHLRLDGGAAETVMEIRICQPWYNTWWAWMMYISVIAALITVFYRHKRQQIELRQQMRMEKEVADMRINLFTQIAHEFRTPLALISGAIDRMGEAATPKKQLQTAQSPTLSRAKVSARENCKWVTACCCRGYPTAVAWCATRADFAM